MPKPSRRLSHSTPPSSKTPRYADDGIDHRKRDGSLRRHRESRRRAQSQAPSFDSLETYYDPRDVYYLSGDDDEPDFTYYTPRGGTSNNSRSRAASPSSDSCPSRSSSRDSYYTRSTRRPPSDSSCSSSPASHRSPHSAAGRVNGRDKPKNNAEDRNRETERSKERLYGIGARDNHPAHPRHRTLSKDRHHDRDRENYRSSSTPRRCRSPLRSPSPRRRSKSAAAARPESRSKPTTAKALAQEAVHNALEGAAIAALRRRHDPSPWLSAKKGGQIAAAALGAAVVDTFVARRLPKRKGGIRHSVARQAAQMVIGGLVTPSSAGGGKGKGIAGKAKGGGGGRMGGMGRGRR
ncbi:hypothetical protein VTI74DRAFT_6472 [Chaetomium olivicolor]